MTRTIAAILAIGLVAACSSPKPTAPVANNMTAADASTSRALPAPDASAAPVAAVPLINLAPEGLSFVDSASGKARMIAFGATRETIEIAATAAAGNPSERGHSAECGAGAMDFTTYADGLQLTFQEGKFIGWTINHKPSMTFATASGIGVGSTRVELDDAYDVKIDETSLGTEFGAGDMSGLLDGTGPKAKITDFWAGTVCIMD